MPYLIDAKISLVPKHQLIVPSTRLVLATNIPTYKATKIHTLTPLTYELFFQNSSKRGNQLTLIKQPLVGVKITLSTFTDLIPII